MKICERAFDFLSMKSSKFFDYKKIKLSAFVFYKQKCNFLTTKRVESSRKNIERENFPSRGKFFGKLSESIK